MLGDKEAECWLAGSVVNRRRGLLPLGLLRIWCRNWLFKLLSNFGNFTEFYEHVTDAQSASPFSLLGPGQNGRNHSATWHSLYISLSRSNNALLRLSAGINHRQLCVWQSLKPSVYNWISMFAGETKNLQTQLEDSSPINSITVDGRKIWTQKSPPLYWIPIKLGNADNSPFLLFANERPG